jgi:LAGLIDADG endonuclease
MMAITPDNQQERLGDYLSGYVDGEGSFHVAIQRNPSTRLGWQLVPEFHVSQNPERASVLLLLKEQLDCGRIQRNGRAGGRDASLVFVVRRRSDLLNKVIPFFESHPILSEKRLEFEAFETIVRAMARGEHLTEAGFLRLLAIAEAMNGNGRYRREKWSNRILRGHTPDTDDASVKIWSDPHGDVGSQAEPKRPGRRNSLRR